MTKQIGEKSALSKRYQGERIQLTSSKALALNSKGRTAMKARGAPEFGR